MCDCRKKKQQVQITNVAIVEVSEEGKVINQYDGVPQTPEEKLAKDLNDWNGGPKISE